jgi:hypothetical protein
MYFKFFASYPNKTSCKAVKRFESKYLPLSIIEHTLKKKELTVLK